MATLQRIGSDKVCLIINDAREFMAQDVAPDDSRGENDTDNGFQSILLSYPDNPIFEELMQFIGGLTEEEKVELVALAWLGREDYTVDEWDQALKDAVERHTGPTAEYLVGMPLLPDYLESGLNQLGYSCEV